MIKTFFSSENKDNCEYTHPEYNFMVCYKIVCTCMTQVSYKLSHGFFFDIHLLVYE